jgi:atypical dual specificity phosphatase
MIYMHYCIIWLVCINRVQTAVLESPTMGKRKVPQDPVALVLPPSLYLGPCSAASSKPFLTENSITHVLSIGANPSTKVDGITYHRLSLSDSVSSSIWEITSAACEVIDEAIASKKGAGKILVHCYAGISRSPMVVAAYLMKRKGMTLKAALRQIIQVRPQISPNAGFLQQLKEMETELYGSCSLEVDEMPKREKDRLALFEEPREQSKEQSNIAVVETETASRGDAVPSTAKAPPQRVLRSTTRALQLSRLNKVSC